MANRYTVYPRTLIFLIRGDKVLLIRRPPHAHPFPGLFNGVGGHVERGEDILSAAVREVEEETGMHVDSLRLCAVLSISHSQLSGQDGEGVVRDDEPGALVFIFVGYAPQGEMISKEAGELRWVGLNQLDELEVVPDLHDILPCILRRDNMEILFLRR
ncbi:MAG: NUDIX domain-containing protein [Anaerolineae bacterium]